MNEKIALAVVYVLGWLIMYVTELFKGYKEPFIRSHYVTIGVIRVVGIVMGFFFLFFLPFVPQARIIGVFGAAAIAIGIAFIGFAAYVMIRFFLEWRKELIALGESRHLFRTGLYGMSRHPTYIAGFFLLWGWCLAWRAVYGLLAMPIILVAFLIEILIEERTLDRKFGEEHARYRQEVPMLLPLPLSLIVIAALAMLVVSILSGWVQVM